jgi:hypothetical protein
MRRGVVGAWARDLPSNITALRPKLFHYVDQTIYHFFHTLESLCGHGLAPFLLPPVLSLPPKSEKRRPIQVQALDMETAGIRWATQDAVGLKRHMSVNVVEQWMEEAVRPARNPRVTFELVTRVTAIDQIVWRIGAPLAERLKMIDG